MDASVLLFDDDPDSVAIYSLIMEHHGYRVLVVSDTKSALEVVRSQQPKLVVIDVDPSESESLLLLRELRDDETTCLLPIIVLNSVQRFDFLGALAAMAGRTSTLIKPCEPTRLIAEIGKVLDIEVPPTVA